MLCFILKLIFDECRNIFSINPLYLGLFVLKLDTKHTAVNNRPTSCVPPEDAANRKAALLLYRCANSMAFPGYLTSPTRSSQNNLLRKHKTEITKTLSFEKNNRANIC